MIQWLREISQKFIKSNAKIQNKFLQLYVCCENYVAVIWNAPVCLIKIARQNVFVSFKGPYKCYKLNHEEFNGNVLKGSQNMGLRSYSA